MSPRLVVTTRRADEDIEAAVGHYLGQGAADAALAFVDALEDAKVLIGEHPQLGSTRLAAETDIPEMRTLAPRRFPYLVFYTNDTDAVRVHRVLHTARDIPSHEKYCTVSRTVEHGAAVGQNVDVTVGGTADGAR